MKILVIDDQEPVLFSLEAILGPKCDNFYKTTSGNEGIQLAEEHQVDLIFLDVSMPEIGGFEVCKKLKENEATKHIPVIFMSAHDYEEAYIAEIGGEMLINKPFEVHEMRILADSYRPTQE